MRNIYIILALFLISCGTSSKIKSEALNLKVIEIEEFSNVYGIKTINENTNEENYIVSYKESYFKESKLSLPVLENSLEIKKNQNYSFKLIPVKPTVGKFKGLGAYIIVSNDTLLRADDYKRLPISYISQNTVGLVIDKI